MDDCICMSITVDNPSDETIHRGLLALLLRLQYEFPIVINIVQVSFFFLELREFVEGLYFHFSMSVCLCIRVSVCLCVRHFLWTKFQPNGCTDLDAVFTKWLIPALAQTLLNLVTLGQRSSSQWRNTHFSSQFSVNFPTFYLSYFIFDQNEIRYVTLIYPFWSICVYIS